jgi:ankyrin repeat protein
VEFEAASDAIVSGDLKALTRLLRENRALIRQRSTREHRATLLHYTSANGVEGYQQKTPQNIVEIAELLLKSGAEVDAEANVYGGGCTTLGLAATSVHPEVAGVQELLLQLLLDYGAEIEKQNLAGNNQGAVISCLANGRPRAGAFLAARDARLDLESAGGIGRLDVVKTFFSPDGALKPPATKRQLQNGFLWACMYGREDVVLFLLEHAARSGRHRCNRITLGCRWRIPQHYQTAHRAWNSTGRNQYPGAEPLWNMQAMDSNIVRPTLTSLRRSKCFSLLAQRYEGIGWNGLRN